MRARSPGLQGSEPGTTGGLGSTRNSLLGHSIHRDNLHEYKNPD